MSSNTPTYLSISRAMEYVGDMASVMSLLGTLHQSLQNDLPLIQAGLDADKLPDANRVLHQVKGFSPVFCTDELVTEVVRVEGLSKGTDIAAVRIEYAQLRPKLEQLLKEVEHQLANPPADA